MRGGRVRRLVTIAAGLLCASPALACDRSPILVRGAMLWSPEGTARRDVLFRDGRVAEVAPPGRIRRTSNTRVIDGAGQTLLPGLIDLHLHFVLPGGLPAGTAPEREHAIAARQLLMSGVTGGRLHLAGLADAAALKAEGADPCAAVPRLQAGGPGMGGGVPEVDARQYRGVRSPEDAAAKVREIARAGLDWVAIHDAARFAPGELEAIASAARGAGLRLMGAADRPGDLEALLAIRPDTLDYIDRTDAPAYPPALVARAAAGGDIAWVPLVGYSHRAFALRVQRGRADAPSHFAFMTEPERAHVRAAAQAVLAQRDGLANPLRAFPALGAKLAQLRNARVLVAMGTDVGSPVHFHSGGIWWELETWRVLGALPGEALRAATETGARVLREPRWGHLGVGANADFVLYRGRIDQGGFDAGRVLAVAKGGVLFVADGEWVGPGSVEGS